MTVSEWLRDHLTQLGRWNVDGVSRRASLRRCRTCGEPVVAGLDAERCGLPALVQPDPLDVVGELLAVAGGRRTFALHGLAIARPELDRRDRFHIAGSPANTERAPYVVGEHRCREPLPTAAKPILTGRRATAPPEIDPPF